MAYSQTVIARAAARLKRARLDHEMEEAERREEIFTREPRLREIDAQLRTTAARVVAEAFRRGQDPGRAIQDLREENLSLQRQREWLLDALELDPDSLEETPLCEACGGTGYVGAVMCSCLKELCRQEQRRALSYLLDAGPDRFEDFRLDLYDDHPSEAHKKYSATVSPRENMEQVLLTCRSFAKGFSRDAESLLFSGAPGLGKTFLSACIARQVSDGGFSVIYDTAVSIFAQFEAAKFGAATEDNRARTDKYLACDLLILDDLGTEMTTQFITSALYTLVNTRLMQGTPTIISTNLSLREIGQRYNEAIYSRLNGNYQYLCFYGADVRPMLRDER